MTTPGPSGARDITVIPRAVISAAVGMVHTVERAVGVGPIRTAADNAWEAVCADRDRARQRDEIRMWVAAFNQSAVGSSPRSRAAQASALVWPVAPTGPAPVSRAVSAGSRRS